MTEAKVVSLRGVNRDPRTASDDVVEMLEEQLERARSGEVVGMATAFLYFDGSIGYDSKGLSSATLIGATYQLLNSLAGAQE